MSNYMNAGLQLSAESDFKDQAMELLRDEGVIFPIRKEPVMSAESHIPFDDRVMLINDDLDIPVGLVSTAYQVLENDRVFDSFLSALQETDIDLSEVRILPTTADYGAKTLTKFRFMNEVTNLSFDDSPIAYELSVSNSFDGTSSYMTRVAGYRLVCSNGMMMAKTLGQQTHFHRSVLDIHESAHNMVNMLHLFKNADKYWGAMLNIELTDEEVESAIRKYFGYGPTVEVMAYTQSSACAHVVRSWKDYSEQFGSNLYSLYQALTDFVSNKHYRRETYSTGLSFNENRLQKFLTSHPGFRQAANEALHAAAA